MGHALNAPSSNGLLTRNSTNMDHAPRNSLAHSINSMGGPPGPNPNRPSVGFPLPTREGGGYLKDDIGRPPGVLQSNAPGQPPMSSALARNQPPGNNNNLPSRHPASVPAPSPQDLQRQYHYGMGRPP